MLGSLLMLLVDKWALSGSGCLASARRERRCRRRGSRPPWSDTKKRYLCMLHSPCTPRGSGHVQRASRARILHLNRARILHLNCKGQTLLIARNSKNTGFYLLCLPALALEKIKYIICCESFRCALDWTFCYLTCGTVSTTM